MTLSKEEQEAVAALDSIKEFEKGYVLISEGQYAKESYYVVTGLVRQFKLNDGVEQTSNFYSEDQSVATISYATRDVPSAFTLICAEASRISIVSFEKEREICKRFPRFEKMCRLSSEQQMIEYQTKFSQFISASPEERYIRLMEEQPDLIDRVPQYHLSSYLGMKPESLSRIRKRLAKK